MARALPLIRDLVFAACLAAGTGHAMAAEPGADCRVPAELVTDDAKLKATALRLHDQKPVTIVAIGGASTAGTAAGNGDQYGYPRRLQEALRRRHPGATVTVLNKGVPRQLTQQMVDRFATDVIPADPTLVLWETGTVDAVRGIDVDQFTDAVQQGIAALRQHNFDVMLVNMQYNPSTGSVINFEPYMEALNHAADLDGTLIFRRFEIMKYWSESGVFDFVDVPKERRVQLAEEVYRCLGDAMAEAIDHAAE
ncbi:MAG TPA: GDSL-type esterase/lipase family protein [Stellaceae bacterium]|nr:GDSL-type esterase/lipase family protein [Stellaceae bacterium]